MRTSESESGSRNCRLCDSTDLEQRFNFPDCQLMRCRDCGFLQLGERPTEEQVRQLYGLGYFERGKYEDRFSDRAEQNRRLNWLSRAGLRPGARLVDAGCATGDFVAAASDRYEAWGFDISQEAVRRATEKYPQLQDRLFAGSLEDVGFELESFDAVVMWDVVEHLYDPLVVIQKIARYLRPGGLLAISTPNAGALIACMMGRRWAFMTPPEHMCFFSPHNLEYLLTQAGLRIINWKSVGKWSTIGFVLYKLSRTFFGIIPSKLNNSIQRSRLGKIAIYVPTGDIQYVAAIR